MVLVVGVSAYFFGFAHWHILKILNMYVDVRNKGKKFICTVPQIRTALTEQFLPMRILSCQKSFWKSQETVPSSVADLRCFSRSKFFHHGYRISDPGYTASGSRIRIQRIALKLSLSEIWSRMFIPDSDFSPFWIPDLGSRGQKSTGSRIRIRNTGPYLIFCTHVIIRISKARDKLLEVLHDPILELLHLLLHLSAQVPPLLRVNLHNTEPVVGKDFDSVIKESMEQS